MVGSRGGKEEGGKERVSNVQNNTLAFAAAVSDERGNEMKMGIFQRSWGRRMLGGRCEMEDPDTISHAVHPEARNRNTPSLLHSLPPSLYPFPEEKKV